MRSRGEQQAPDEYRANLLSGVHAGYWVLDELCIAIELRYQRWLSTPKALQDAAENRQNLSTAVGLRTSISSAGVKMLPSIAYATGGSLAFAKVYGRNNIHQRARFAAGFK